MKKLSERRRADSEKAMKLARKFMANGHIDAALDQAFYAGMREADAQEAEHEEERELQRLRRP